MEPTLKTHRCTRLLMASTKCDVIHDVTGWYRNDVLAVKGLPSFIKVCFNTKVCWVYIWLRGLKLNLTHSIQAEIKIKSLNYSVCTICIHLQRDPQCSELLLLFFYFKSKGHKDFTVTDTDSLFSFYCDWECLDGAIFILCSYGNQGLKKCRKRRNFNDCPNQVVEKDKRHT